MEQSFVQKAKSGDKQAFAQLYLSYKDKLYRYAYYRLGNEQDALDALSICITHAFASISSLKNEQAFSAWIFKIMHYACCCVLNDRKKHALHLNVDDISENMFSEQANTLSAELKEALALLSEQEKEIVLLSVVAGYKSREIAALLDSTPGSVRSTLSRSLAKMRNFLSE